MDAHVEESYPGMKLWHDYPLSGPRISYAPQHEVPETDQLYFDSVLRNQLKEDAYEKMAQRSAINSELRGMRQSREEVASHSPFLEQPVNSTLVSHTIMHVTQRTFDAGDTTW